MKIVVFCAYFFPHKGGVERYIDEIYRRIVKENVSVDIVTCNTEKTSYCEVINGLRVFRLDCWNTLGNTYPVPKINKKFWETFKTLKREDYDFVNTQTRFFLTTLLGFLFAKLYKIRLIHTEHGTQHSILSNPLTIFLSRLYDHILGYLVIRYTDYNIAVSKAAGEFSKHLGAKNYKVIYNGVDLEKFERRETDLKSRLGIRTDYRIITFIGRLIEAKGVQDLIKVFKNINKEFKAKLLIIGESNFKDELINLAGQDKDIMFLGEKEEDGVVEILSTTDVFVNPSYSEGLPTSVLEAGACSCPVVATNVGGTNEIIDNGKNGFLVQPHDLVTLQQKIEILLSKRSLATLFGDQLNKKINSIFNWSHIRTQFLGILKTI